PQRGDAGECGNGVASGLVVQDQAVADQAQRLDVVGGVAQRLLDVEQERGGFAAPGFSRTRALPPCAAGTRHGMAPILVVSRLYDTKYNVSQHVNKMLNV